MSLNRPTSNGSKRPRAEDYYRDREDLKRTKSDDHGLRDEVSDKDEGDDGACNLPSKPPPPSQGITNPETDAYGRRDFPERRNSKDNTFVRPGDGSAAPVPTKSSIQSPISLNGQTIPTGPRARMPSSPGSNKSQNTEYFPACSRVPSGGNTPIRPNSAHNIRASPPAPIQSNFSDNDSIRSGSFDTASSKIAPVAPMMNRSASNSPRSANAVLDPRKRPTGPSNLQPLRQDAHTTTDKPVSSFPSPDDLPRLLTEARAKQKEAKAEHDGKQKRLAQRMKVRGGSDNEPLSEAMVKLMNEEAFARNALQAADNEVSRLENTIQAQESSQQADQDVSKLEELVRTQGPTPLESTASMPQAQSGQNTEQREDITVLQQQLTSLREQLERENTNRDRENTELRNQLAEFQQVLNESRAKQEAERGDREKKIDQEIRLHKDALQAQFKEAVQEIQTQARIDREEDLSTHNTVLGQIKTFQSEIAIFKNDMTRFRREHAQLDKLKQLDKLDKLNEFDKDIDDMFKRMSDFRQDFRQEIRTENSKNLANIIPLTKEVTELTIWKRKIDASISNYNTELASVRKDVNSIRDQNKEPRNKTDTISRPDPNMVVRLDALEAFQTSATQSMNNMSTGLKSAAKSDDLEILQESLAKVAYDAAQGAVMEAAKIATKEATEVFNKLTARIDTVETKIMPDEDVRTRLTACETNLTKVVKWVGQRPEDDPDDGTLTIKVANLETTIDGTPNLPDGHENKAEAMIDIIGRVEEAVENCANEVTNLRENMINEVNGLRESMSELEKPKPQQDEPQINTNFQEETKGRISDLEVSLENKRLVFEGQINSSFEDLKKKVDQMITGSHNTIAAQLRQDLSPLKQDLKQERAARVDLDTRFRSSRQGDHNTNIGPLRADIEAVKQTQAHFDGQMRGLFGQVQNVNPEAIAKDLKKLYNMCIAAQVATSSLEGRFSSITTTTLVQMMLDQVHHLVPPDKDLISVIKDISRHDEDIRQMRNDLKAMPDKLALDNKSGMDGTATLKQAIDTYEKNVEEYQKKADALEGQQEIILEKLSDLQNQLGLDEETLHSDPTLRVLIERSMADLREGIQQLMPGEEQSGTISEEVINEKLKAIVGNDVGALASEHQSLNKRVSALEEESSKASTVSPLDPSRYAKKAHVDELKDTVLKLGTRMDKFEGEAKNTGAGADESEDDSPLMAARKSSLSTMGKYKVTDSPRQRHPNNYKNRKNGPTHISIPDSEEER